MTGSIEEVVGALARAEVRFLVVGGVAVVLHGHLRTTADLDLWVELSEGNLRRAVACLRALGYRPRAPVEIEDLVDPAKRQDWVQQKGLVVFSLWHPERPFELDLFVRDPFDFGEARRRALSVRLETTEAPVIGLDDLIAMKERTGRAQDAEDVSALRSLRDGPGSPPAPAGGSRP